jgi:hypothetical protein
LSNFIRAACSTLKAFCNVLGDRSKWPSTSSEGEESGETFIELKREDDDADGWKCLDFLIVSLTLLRLEEGTGLARGGQRAGAKREELNGVVD